MGPYVLLHIGLGLAERCVVNCSEFVDDDFRLSASSLSGHKVFNSDYSADVPL